MFFPSRNSRPSALPMTIAVFVTLACLSAFGATELGAVLERVSGPAVTEGLREHATLADGITTLLASFFGLLSLAVMAPLAVVWLIALPLKLIWLSALGDPSPILMHHVERGLSAWTTGLLVSAFWWLSVLVLLTLCASLPYFTWEMLAAEPNGRTTFLWVVVASLPFGVVALFAAAGLDLAHAECVRSNDLPWLRRSLAALTQGFRRVRTHLAFFLLTALMISALSLVGHLLDAPPWLLLPLLQLLAFARLWVRGAWLHRCTSVDLADLAVLADSVDEQRSPLTGAADSDTRFSDANTSEHGL